MTVERWGVHELALTGPADGNPDAEVRLGAEFQHRNRIVPVDGFYDGDGRYRIRFMPDAEGEWHYVTRSSAAELDGARGSFTCVPPAPGNRGPVRVAGTHRLSYADGTPYLPLGTTCYHWTHLDDHEREEQTLRSLAASPFTKVRMCLLPTKGMVPPHLVFAGDSPDTLDRTRFNPVFWAHFERRLRDLLALGIQADVILFHPYDDGFWGLDRMSREEDFFLLKHTLARLSAFRHVWWSVSNEYDFNTCKTVEDWDALGRFIQRHDPYQRLRSIHNGTRMYQYERIYDFGKPWITHQSIQHWDARLTAGWRDSCPKPVVVDEIGYEGTADRRWGNLSGRALVRQFWHAAVAGGHVTHGEAYPDAGRDGTTWISGGGRLRGESVPRIAFLRRLLEEAPADLPRARREGTSWLEYFGGPTQSAYRDVELPAGGEYRIELIDTWQMTVTELAGVHHGRAPVELKGRPDMAVRIRRTR
ncbi:DUF5060 domain-containing protein [Streptomyces sp. NBC_01808]|uniref:DUF5060 domain-containing protein n=1 Tax=Streptomyces sp. NBC_01808 TaxID=2975947 RepID=UPI002DDA80D9|nr:DUF5060 domain-containing protein [Streptomyces sp. NBC_01808]WSA35992.1 DUF5060 domain-containing protein [Streptomyces sp. NBC_01808]